jgi:hypothetical protein
MSKYKAVAEILKAAQAQVNALLTAPEDELHRLQITQNLQMQADRILLITGTSDITENKSTVLGPATTIGGKPIAKIPKITERDLLPSDDKVLNLKEQVNDALVYFSPESNSAGILANIPDIVIRGVAKKAGFHVTKDEPAVLNIEFIDRIKEALAASENISPKLPLTPGVGGIKEVITVPADAISNLGDETNTASPETPAIISETETQITETDLIEKAPEPLPQTEQPKPESKKHKPGK